MAGAVDILQRKLEQLEKENVELRQSTEECLVKTDYFEAKEETLLKECVAQLTQANNETRQLKNELDNKSNILHKQQEEKTKLLAELVDLQKKYNNVSQLLTLSYYHCCPIKLLLLKRALFTLQFVY